MILVCLASSISMYEYLEKEIREMYGGGEGQQERKLFYNIKLVKVMNSCLDQRQ